MRLSPFADDAALDVGVMAASPDGEGCDVTLRGFEITPGAPS